MLDNRLQTFIVLTEFKNYTKTAEKLHMTQPAVSQHIRHLEAYYDVELLQKRRRELHLTYEGEALLKYAVKVKGLATKIRKELSEKGQKGRYVLGCTQTIGEYLIPDIIVKYSSKKPETEVSLRIENTKRILEGLEREEWDLGIVEGSFNRKRYEHSLLKMDELILVVSPENPISRRKCVELEELLKEKLILREAGSGTRRRFEAETCLRGINIEEFHYIEVGNLNVIKTLVERNMGISIISREAVRDGLQRGTLIEVKIKGVALEREFNFVWLKGSYNREFIEDFTSYCVEEIA